MRTFPDSDQGSCHISFPESSFPLTSGRKTRALGATIQACALDADWMGRIRLFSLFFKLVASRALGTRLGSCAIGNMEVARMEIRKVLTTDSVKIKIQEVTNNKA